MDRPAGPFSNCRAFRLPHRTKNPVVLISKSRSKRERRIFDKKMSRTKATEWPEVANERNCISEGGPSLVSLSEEVTIPDSVLDDSGHTVGSDNVFGEVSPTDFGQFAFPTMESPIGSFSTRGSSALTSSDLSSLKSFEGHRGQPTPNLTPMSPKENLDEELLLKATSRCQISPKETKKEQRGKIPAERDTEPFEEDAVIFQLAKWNHVSLWKWDVDCDVCAICRVVICDPCLTVSQFLITV